LKVLLITYDLKEPKQQYANFFAEFQKTTKWWHYLESTWLVYTELTPKQWSDTLVPKIYDKDYLLIIEVTPSYYGWLPKDAWAWIKENLG